MIAVHSQPFCGNMVAAIGAGPKPIPYKALTVRNLTDAITYGLTPHAANVARDIAKQMKQECGVRAAVDSFHAHLPRDTIQCDLVPYQPAVWKFKKGKETLTISKVAAWTLIHHGRLQQKHFKR